ncbi:MAG: thioredoxin domain-containing protein [Epsilonproteobacteria bacterium]|nr:thioredoxin domain-containing protein [Campylobacterota bacterium]
MNRLIKEDSPYLQLHAHNPIDWYPWGEDAFARAKRENKPIFLSIGYSSCHWCHVMERESFENIEIAKILNNNFISIKVDKEERPDIDKHYQEVFYMMNGKAGGWPTSIFMSSELEPFYSTTYIPIESIGGIMDIKTLLHLIIKRYQEDKELLHSKGKELLEFMSKKQTTIQATKLNLSIIDTTISHAHKLTDTTNGGFGFAPKFPHASTLELLLDVYLLNKDESILKIVTKSLDEMSKGGLYDRVDGGFCRYSVDNIWLVPHFEKMSYDNALLSYIYTKAYLITKNPKYKEVAIETIEFMLSYMSENGLFYSASDADSDGVEGAYFVYSYDEVEQTLRKSGYSKGKIDEIMFSFNITKKGNFEGKNIIRVDKPIKEYKEVIELLKNIRKERKYPFIDKKIITSINAMMIKSLFFASHLDTKYKDIAIDSLEKLVKKVYIDKKLYHTTLIHKNPKIDCFLEDSAYLAEAMLEAYRFTLDEGYLIGASSVANSAIEKFYDNGKWYFSKGQFSTYADSFDSSYPSSLSTMLCVLLSLSSLVEFGYKKMVYRTLEVQSYEVARQPLSRPKLTSAVIRYFKDDIIVKSTKNNLLSHIYDEKLSSYPYTLLRNTLDEKFLICNSNSCFGEERSFEEIKNFIGV